MLGGLCALPLALAVYPAVAGDGSTPVGSSPEQSSAHIKSEIAKWRKLAKEANLKLH